MSRIGLSLAVLLAVAPRPVPAQPTNRGLERDDGDAGASAVPGRKVAFLVGVGAFKHDLPDLGGSPQKDAAALAGVLKEGGFEVVTLTDADATKAKTEARFRAVLDGDGNAAKALGKQDLLLVVVCTHGFSLPPAAGQPDAPFLAAHDSKLDKPDTMVGLNGLIDAGKSSGATVLFLLDACRELSRDKNRGFEATQAVLPAGTAVLFGCGRGQVSHQSEKAGGHGLFTYAVLKTLRGENGLNGEISWTELVSAVQRMFRSAEFRALLPDRKSQTPFAAGGELAFTTLLTVQSGLSKDLMAFRSIGPPGPRGDAKRAENLREAGPTRRAVWRDSAEKGDTAGQVLYGNCFLFGIGVPKDEAEVVKWFRRAADAGDTGVMMHLSRCHSEVPHESWTVGKRCKL